jgi:hypothetical protein
MSLAASLTVPVTGIVMALVLIIFRSVMMISFKRFYYYKGNQFILNTSPPLQI